MLSDCGTANHPWFTVIGDNPTLSLDAGNSCEISGTFLDDQQSSGLIAWNARFPYPGIYIVEYQTSGSYGYFEFCLRDPSPCLSQDYYGGEESFAVAITGQGDLTIEINSFFSSWTLDWVKITAPKLPPPTNACSSATPLDFNGMGLLLLDALNSCEKTDVFFNVLGTSTGVISWRVSFPHSGWYTVSYETKSAPGTPGLGTGTFEICDRIWFDDMRLHCLVEHFTLDETVSFQFYVGFNVIIIDVISLSQDWELSYLQFNAVDPCFTAEPIEFVYTGFYDDGVGIYQFLTAALRAEPITNSSQRNAIFAGNGFGFPHGVISWRVEFPVYGVYWMEINTIGSGKMDVCVRAPPMIPFCWVTDFEGDSFSFFSPPGSPGTYIIDVISRSSGWMLESIDIFGPSRRTCNADSFLVQFDDSVTGILDIANYCETNIDNPETYFVFSEEDQFVSWNVRPDRPWMYTLMLDVKNNAGEIGDLQIQAMRGSFSNIMIEIPDEADWIVLNATVPLQAITETVRVEAITESWLLRTIEIVRANECGSFLFATEIGSATVTLDTSNYCERGGVILFSFSSPFFFEYLKSDDFVSWEVTVLQTGSYKILYEYRSNDGGELLLCRVSVDCFTALSFEETNGEIMMVEQTIEIDDGNHILGVTTMTPSWKLYSIQISKIETESPSFSPSNQPSARPSRRPSSVPSKSPSERPSASPSTTPSKQPSSKPSAFPSRAPSRTPSRQPSSPPSRVPSSSPSSKPSDAPSSRPIGTNLPSRIPSSYPSSKPSDAPSSRPIGTPSTSSPLAIPSRPPTATPNSIPVPTTGTPFGTSTPTTSIPTETTLIPTTRQPVEPSSTTPPTGTPVRNPVQGLTFPPTGTPNIAPIAATTTSLPTSPLTITSMPTTSPQTGAPIILPIPANTQEPTSTPNGLPIPITTQPTGAPNSTPPPSRSETDTPVSFTIPATTQPSGAPNVISIPTTMQPSVAPNSTPGPSTAQPTVTPNNTPIPTTRLPTTVPFSQTSPAPVSILVVIDDLPTQRPSSQNQVRQLTSQPSSWRPTTKPSDSSTPPMPIPPTPPPSSTLAPTLTTQSPESSGSNSPSMYPTFAYSITRTSNGVVVRLPGVGELSMIEIATFLEISEIWLEENYNEYFTTQTLNKIRGQRQRSRSLERRREARLIQVKLEFVSQAVTLRNERPTNTLTYNEVITYSSREAVQNFGPDTLRSAVLGDPDVVEILIARLKEAIPSMSELEGIVLMPRKVEDSSGLSDWGLSGILLGTSFMISFGSLVIYSMKVQGIGFFK